MTKKKEVIKYVYQDREVPYTRVQWKEDILVFVAVCVASIAGGFGVGLGMAVFNWVAN